MEVRHDIRCDLYTYNYHIAHLSSDKNNPQKLNLKKKKKKKKKKTINTKSELPECVLKTDGVSQSTILLYYSKTSLLRPPLDVRKNGLYSGVVLLLR